ncbi:RNA 2',3'-cyclic phosphodiesterase [Candidatus Omnitrophota bacterium]
MFIAIPLPEETRSSLSKLQEQLSSSGADVKWVNRQNIHLTLKFLGDVDERQADVIKEIIDEVAAKTSHFRIVLASAGAFPKLKYPRVIWVGVGQGDDETKSLADSLEEEIVSVGIPKEKRIFSSHITIGRVRSQMNRAKLIAALEAVSAGISGGKNLEFTADRIVLFKSTLTPSGPVYEIFKDASLTTA